MKPINRAMRRSKPRHWIIVAGLMGSAENVLPLFQDTIPRGPFAILTVCACIAGVWSMWLQRKAGGDA